MQVTIISDEDLKNEWLSHGSREGVEVHWINNIYDLAASPGILVDLLFAMDKDRIHSLNNSGADLIVINSVLNTLSETGEGFVRINGWKTFLGNAIVEGSANADARVKAENLFAHFNKSVKWVPDVPGFITPRVISSIINEAFTALDEDVSTKEEIDTAMKLGTNYPFGPFEWAEKIGINNISTLLYKLSIGQSRYRPHPNLSLGL